MKTAPLLLAGLGLLAAATLVASVAYSRRNSALREENQALASVIEEATPPQPDNQQLRADNAEVQRLKEENRDLPSLRNEVRQLREAVTELPSLQAENQRLRSNHPTASGGVEAVDVAREAKTSISVTTNDVVLIQTPSGAAAVVQFTEFAALENSEAATYRWRSYASKSQPIRSGTGVVHEWGIHKEGEIPPADDTTVRAGDIVFQWSMATGGRGWLYYSTNLATVRILGVEDFEKDF